MMLRKKTKAETAVVRSNDPFEDPTSIGNVLLKLGKVTYQQLWIALGQKAQFDEHLLGAMLKQLGYVCDMDIALALKVQAEMRQGNSLNAELEILQVKMDESERGARELRKCISTAKTNRRDRGERTDVFLLPTLSRARS